MTPEQPDLIIAEIKQVVRLPIEWLENPRWPHHRAQYTAASMERVEGWTAIGNQTTCRGGTLQHFVDSTRGALATLCAHPEHGRWWVLGAIRDKWHEIGAVYSRFEWPCEPARLTRDGCGEIQRFSGAEGVAAIVSHPEHGTFIVEPAIDVAWTALGGEEKLGLPECDTMGGPQSRFNQFLGSARCRIYTTAAHGVVVVADPLFTVWYDSGGDRGPLGIPVGNERVAALPGSREQPFERGTIRVSHDGEVCIVPAEPQT